MNNEEININERLTNIEVTLNTVSQQLSAQIQALTDIVGEQEKRLIRLESDMQEVKSNVGYIREDMRTIHARIDNLDSRIDNLNQSLSGRIERLEQSVDARIDNLAGSINRRLDRFYIVLISALIGWGTLLIAILKFWK